MRKDAKKNLRKVTTELLKDDEQGIEAIAKKTGLSVGNVHDKLKKVENVEIKKDKDVIRIAKADLEHLEMIQGIELDHIKEYADKANRGEFFKPNDLHSLSSIAEKKQKRYSIMMGDNTDENGAEKISNEKQELIKGLLEKL